MAPRIIQSTVLTIQSVATGARVSVRHRSATRAQRCVKYAYSSRDQYRTFILRVGIGSRSSQIQTIPALIGRARTTSSEMETGTSAPPFELLEPATGKLVSLSQLSDGASATLVMWWCNHCPFVIHLKEAVVALVKEFEGRGLAAVAISSNSVLTHPQDGPDEMALDAKRYGYQFPYLYDSTQEVAVAYGACCTPEFYVFDRDLKLQYHGQFDSSRPRTGVAATGDDLRAALEDVLAQRSVQAPIKPSIGCSIKWEPKD